MMAGSHVALGAAAWFVAAPRLGLPALAVEPLALAVLGSLLPDIDHPRSWLGQRLKPVSRLCAALLGHRGVTHSALAVFGCLWLLARHDVPERFAAPLVVGYLSHLAADLLTPAGLRLAWPMRGTWSLPLCRTGSPFEPLLVAVILAWAWGNTTLPEELKAELRASPLCRLLAHDPPAFCAGPQRPGPGYSLAQRSAPGGTVATR